MQLKPVKGEDMTAEERRRLLTQEEKEIYQRRQRDKKFYRGWVPHLYEALYGPDIDTSPKIELRSEKVRNIIGQVPPVLLRYGIVIIGLALLALVGVSAFIPYQPGVDIEITVTQTADGTLHYSTHIPRSAIKHKAKFEEVVLAPSSTLSLPTRYRIEYISDIIHFTQNKALQTATLIPTEDIPENVVLDKPINVPGKILLEKQSVMMWLAGKVTAPG